MSKTKHNAYKSPLAQCPVYNAETTNVIFCCGYTEDTSIHLAFGNKTSAKEYKYDFCQGNYRGCPIYQMLEQEMIDNDLP